MEREQGFDAAVRRLVGWRVRANRALIFFAVLLVALPLGPMIDRAGLRGLWPGLVEIFKAWWSVVGLNLRPLIALYCGIWPWALVVLAVMAGLWWLGGDLQGRIKDKALRVWRFPA